jgi:thioesterase domain-containing protein
LSVAELLSQLREKGIELSVDGDRLRCVAERGALTPSMSQQIREHKAEILELLGKVSSQAGRNTAALNRRSRAEPRYGLSHTQRRSIVDAREGGKAATAFRLRGPLDFAALRATLEHIVARHAPLRTRFHLDLDPPEQEVIDSIDVELSEEDLSGVPEDERAAKLEDALEAQRAIGFDVTRMPLFRFRLFRLSNLEHVLYSAFSALTFDGWSFDVYWRDLQHGYAALSCGQPWPLPDLPIDYGDYVAWQQEHLQRRDRELAAFWRGRLGNELPPLPLPTDRPRTRLVANRFENLPFALPPETVHELRSFARQVGATPQIVMLAAVYVLVHRLGGEKRIVVGSPINARVHPSMEGLIGPFVNMLLLPMDVDPMESFAVFVARVRDDCLSAYDHQEYPIDKLNVRSSPNAIQGLTAAFQVEFSFQQATSRGSHMGALALSQNELGWWKAAGDMTLWVKDWGERIGGALQFKTDIYDGGTIGHWFACYKHLLKSLIEAPDGPISDVDLLGSEVSAVEAAARKASEAPPEWALPAIRGLAQDGGSVQLRVTDDRKRLRPLGVFGRLQLVRDGQHLDTGLVARISPDGTLLSGPTTPTVSSSPRRGQREAPRTELEIQITALFAQLLDVGDVGVTDDYFELGGNSLTALRLFNEIHGRFGLRLPLATLLDAGTPRALSQVIVRQYPNRESCLVKLTSGAEGKALFLVHDADGETLLYMNLARRMPDSLGVYGIEPLRLGSVAMVHTSLAAAARHYITEMRRVQPRGPYLFGGLCAGAMLCFEIARQLVASGETVGLLALIDAAPPNARKRQTLAAERWDRFSALSGDLRRGALVDTARKALKKISNVVRFETDRQCHRIASETRFMLLRHVYRGGMGWPSWLAPPTPRELIARAEKDFEPRIVDSVNAVLFRATRGAGTDRPFCELLADPCFDWQPLFERPVRAIDVPGGHSTMLQEPNVEFMARSLTDLLESDSLLTPVREQQATSVG